MEHYSQHRTQIYLPPGLHQKAKRVARKTNQSLSGAIRLMVADFNEIKLTPKTKPQENGWSRFLNSAANISLPADMAQSHDYYWDLD